MGSLAARPTSEVTVLKEREDDDDKDIEGGGQQKENNESERLRSSLY